MYTTGSKFIYSFNAFSFELVPQQKTLRGKKSELKLNFMFNNIIWKNVFLSVWRIENQREKLLAQTAATMCIVKERDKYSDRVDTEKT